MLMCGCFFFLGFMCEEMLIRGQIYYCWQRDYGDRSSGDYLLALQESGSDEDPYGGNSFGICRPQRHHG